MLDGNAYTSTTDVKCLPEVKNVTISSPPSYTTNYYSSRSYKNINAACYWETISDS